jgi:hypothetical protein
MKIQFIGHPIFDTLMADTLIGEMGRHNNWGYWSMTDIFTHCYLLKVLCPLDVKS